MSSTKMEGLHPIRDKEKKRKIPQAVRPLPGSLRQFL